MNVKHYLSWLNKDHEIKAILIRFSKDINIVYKSY